MKLIKIFALLPFVMMLISWPLHAAELSLGSANILQNETAMLNLNITGGTEPYAGINAKILLPKGITINSIGKGELLSSGNFITEYSMSSNTADNTVIVIAYSGTDTFTASSSGTILTLNLKADTTISSGTHTVQFADTNTNALINSKYALSDATGTKSLIPTVKAGTITVEQDTDNDDLGDSWETVHFGNLDQNGTDDYDSDGFTNKQEYYNGTDPKLKNSITLADVIAVLQINSGINVSIVNLDMNGNEKIGIEDAVYMLQKISGLK